MDIVRPPSPAKTAPAVTSKLYGDNLLAVRDRLDGQRQIRCTTVEIIIKRRAARMLWFA